MFKKSLLPLALTFASVTAFAADHNFERKLSTSGSPNVTVATGSGYVHLRPGSDNQVHIAAHLHGSNNGGWFSGGYGDVDKRIDQIVANPPVQQNGNDIIIGERQSRDLYRNISIDYEITLPRASTITATSGSGDVESQDVGQNVKAETGSGSVRLRGVHGPAYLRSGSGDIELDEQGQGDVRASTGSGSIRLRGVDGGLNAESGSGDIEISGRVANDWRLQTGSGSIRSSLGDGARFTLSASTGSGDIRVHQPLSMQSSANHHHVTGAVNGGGPNLRASTGSGDIEIK
ncbi:Putative adhesin [Granulicella pectinivorans]|uniref:Putative adhesin n=1 Tax=Granulicella pectinivorans TaxID=474950 RepID=A0A1I6MNW5_9BACT|nr:DUF4097 family beta strand repeat-containing protein [Granulicella pectinivorans]SFS17379.1 Putative adhesin [Granulicella pectinivorans]